MRAKTSVLLLIICLCFLAAPAAAESGIKWQKWSADLFARAKAENRFVLLDMDAVWCHWCHVMEETTYHDPAVVALINKKYIPVRVDQDANPDLSNRYGDWGWPATIVFAPDGTEIIKRQGYIPPIIMASILQAIIDDPSPGPSIIPETPIKPAAHPLLGQALQKQLEKRFAATFDAAQAGWGTIHKFIHAESMDLVLARATEGDQAAADQTRRTLDKARALIDPVWGGVYQYSDKRDWSSPHYEKIMSYQASYLRQYALAFSLWGRSTDRDAAERIYAYLTEMLLSPEGAFYTSQDADLSTKVSGKVFYGSDRAGRGKLGMPRVDKNSYARENGWAISALIAWANASGAVKPLAIAEKAMRWTIANRRRAHGGFAHGANDRGGPYLGDSIAMAQAAVGLYAATGNRHWLGVARKAADFVEARLKADDAGFYASAAASAGTGVFKTRLRLAEENIQAARVFNQLYRYTGQKRFRSSAEHAMRYLASEAVAEQPRYAAGLLLIDRELAREPVHITIVGAKNDPRSAKLHAAARRYAALYKRIDWWDKREGPLPNPDVTYPELEQPAAFACTNRICSLPVFKASKVATAVDRTLKLTRQRAATK